MNELSKVVEDPARPLCVVLGGAKVSDKVGVIERFLDTADQILIGGAMCFSFFKAQGKEIGDSLFDDVSVEAAREALAKAEASDCELVLPVDLVLGREFSRRHRAQRGRRDRGAGRLDGPRRRPEDRRALRRGRRQGRARCSGTGRWAPSRWSPSRAARGRSPRRSPSASGKTVVGGGDSVAAMVEFGLSDQVDWLSTGGGASLELLEGKKLPGVEALIDAKVPATNEES